ncbi:MAG: NAD-dependent epimerase, partial [Rhizobiales bacterium]|nr:NAD-dependent epimerase [Hyphomicrobiales bacterium]
MHVMIIGAAGMIGRKLANKIAETSTLGNQKVRHLSLVDVVEPSQPDGFSGDVSLHTTDASQDGRAAE